MDEFIAEAKNLTFKDIAETLFALVSITAIIGTVFLVGICL